MPIKSRIADPRTQNKSNTINAVVLLRRVNLRDITFTEPLRKGCKYWKQDRLDQLQQI